MPNKKTRALTEEQNKQILRTIKEGFLHSEGKVCKPNEHLAAIRTWKPT